MFVLMNIPSEHEHVCDLGTVSMKDSSETRDTKICNGTVKNNYTEIYSYDSTFIN